MALSDLPATEEQLFESERRVREWAELREHAAALEAARASEERMFVDDAGTTWRYVTLDDAEVRILGCETEAAVLVIPEEVECKPVVALGPDACAYLKSVQEIVCPRTLLSIGFCAFRFCTNLRRAVLPENISEYDSNWFRSCPKLESLTLPGQLGTLTPEIFDTPSLRTLVIGSGASNITPGTFAKSQLENVVVSEDNVFIKTDGTALYTADGSALIALARPVERYEVAEGCRIIARKALSNFKRVAEVVLPESVEVIGAFAFANTSVTAFESPAALKLIDEKAFFNCASLERVELGEGLAVIGQNAFTNTGISELVIPASIEDIAYPVAERTALVYAGEGATFRIAEGSQNLRLDNAGGLYRDTEEGKVFVRLMDPYAERYAVDEGTKIVGENACLSHGRLREVVLPEGLVKVGNGAFRDCRKLERVNLPESMESIGDEAFLDTNITSLHVPAGLVSIGQNALVTWGAHNGSSEPSLKCVTVDADNPRYYTQPGFLLERKRTGTEGIVLCTGGMEVLRVPEKVNSVSPYAFNGVRGVRELHISDRIMYVGVRGLAVGEWIEKIVVHLAEPYKGHDSFTFDFPNTDRSVQQMLLALGVPDHVDVAQLFEYYDTSIVTGSSFDPKMRAGLSVYDQGTRILKRLLDPVHLKYVNRSLFDRFLTSNLADLCVAIAKHDDRRSIDALVDLGYINADNIFEIIDRVSAVQDASITGYLLEVKRLRLEDDDPFDFDL